MSDMSREEAELRFSKGYQDALRRGLEAVHAANAAATAARHPYDIDLTANIPDPKEQRR